MELSFVSTFLHTELSFLIKLSFLIHLEIACYKSLWHEHQWSSNGNVEQMERKEEIERRENK